MAKIKEVKQSANPYKGKAPKGGEKADGLGAMHFTWRCNYVDLDGTWGFHIADCESLWRDIIPRLHSFESMTWNEIMSPRSTSDHTMPVSELADEAKKRLGTIGLGQLDNLFQLSVAGKPRLWGYKDRAIFYLLWYDPDHTVYPISKKNT